MRVGATVALAAAFLLVLLLQRMFRDAGTRHDTRYFFAAGAFAALRLVGIAFVLLAGHSLHEPTLTSFGMFAAALASNAYLVLFSYSFPFNRRAPIRVRLLVAIPTFVFAAFVFSRPDVARWFPIASVAYFVPLAACAAFLQFRNHRAILRESGRAAAIPIGLVQSGILIPWFATVAATVLATRTYGFPPPPWVMLTTSTAATLIIATGVGIAIMRYHLFEVSVMAYEMVLGVVASVALATYVTYGAPALYTFLAASGGVSVAAPVVSIVPPLVLGGAWISLAKHIDHFACVITRGTTPRSAVERVIDVTRNMVDPQGILAMVAGEMAAVTGGGDVRFLRAGDLPSTEYESAPACMLRYFQDSDRSFLARTHQAELEYDAADALDRLGASIVVPVRRGQTIYGVFVVSSCDLARNVALACVGLADHLAIKLENYALFTEAAKQRREFDEAHERLSRQLEESRRLAALGSFAAAIAHDIRTPLTSIQMNVQIVRSKSALSESDREYLDIAVEEIDRLNRSVGGILDYAKPFSPNAVWADPSDWIDEARQSVTAVHADRAIAFDFSEPRHDVQLYIDVPRMKQVLVNMLDNAAIASPKGAVVFVQITLHPDGSAGFDVVDSGRGIKGDDLAKVFEPFFTTRPDGTGLGLSTAQKIVRAHGGEISVESTPGERTRFSVRVPPERVRVIAHRNDLASGLAATA